MPKRNIIEIDESRCDGCGLCASACAEGAIQIIDGKAKLISDVYCDGLGACLGHCPQDAIRIIQREAEDFDEQTVELHLKKMEFAKRNPTTTLTAISHPKSAHAEGTPCGCPGSQARTLNASPVMVGGVGEKEQGRAASMPSALGNWPVQLKLIPPNAPYLREADLLLAADCAPFALADFHERLLRGRPLAIACPKLDDGEFYVQKLARIIQENDLRSLTVARMEVPCCGGLSRIAQAAIALSGKDVRFDEVTVSIDGRVI